VRALAQELYAIDFSSSLVVHMIDWSIFTLLKSKRPYLVMQCCGVLIDTAVQLCAGASTTTAAPRFGVRDGPNARPPDPATRRFSAAPRPVSRPSTRWPAGRRQLLPTCWLLQLVQLAVHCLFYSS
jgi:hypothetical protein